MSTNITLKRSSVQGKVPVVGDLALGEIALNTYDGKLFIKKNVNGTESIVDVTANTNLTLTSNSSTVSVNSDRGTDVTILAANATTAGVLTADAQTIAGSKTLTGTTTISSTAPRLDFFESGGSTGFNNTTLIRDADVFAVQTRDGGTFVSNDYRITTNASGALTHEWRIGNTERMRIEDNGNIGIGTTAPAVPLHIERPSNEMLRLRNTTAGTGSGYISFYENTGTRVGWIGNSSSLNTNLQITNETAASTIFNINGSEAMRITANGNVGIGTTSPTFASGSGLELERDSATATIRLQRLNTGSSSTELRSANGLTELYALAGGQGIAFGTGVTERMRIDSAGNVGIGNTTPADKLSVSGAVTATSFNATSGFIENSQTLASNYTLVTGRNAMSTGPITISDGVTITIQDSARWVVI